MSKFWIRNVAATPSVELGPGWNTHTLARNQSTRLGSLSAYYMSLDPGVEPHAPHEHDEHELLVVHRGQLTLVHPEGDQPVGPGAVAYYPPGARHTCRGADVEATRFFTLKWLAPTPRVPSDAPSRRVVMRLDQEPTLDTSPGPRRRAQPPIDLGQNLHLVVSQSAFGQGQDFPVHAHEYDFLQLMLRGTLHGLGYAATAPAASYFAAGVMHGLSRPMPEDSLHIDLEIHSAAAA